MSGFRCDALYESGRDRRQRFSKELQTYQDPRVLLGNWFDERARTEAETEELVDKYYKKQLPFQKLDRYLHVLSEPVQLTRNLDGFLHHGDVVRLKWTDEDGKNYFLAALPFRVGRDETFLDPCLATGTAESRILTRTAFHVFRNNNNVPNHLPLVYGERIQLSTVESTGHRFLHCEPKAFHTSTRQTKHQEVTWEKELTARAIWNVLAESKKERLRLEGHFIPVNTKVLISNLATGQNLALEKDTSVATTFGPEKEVSCHTYIDTHKVEGMENKWQFEAPLIKPSEYGEPMVMPPYRE